MSYTIDGVSYADPTIGSVEIDAVYGQEFTAEVNFTTDPKAGPGTVYRWHVGGMGVHSVAPDGVITGRPYNMGGLVIPVSVKDANDVSATGTVTVNVHGPWLNGE